MNNLGLGVLINYLGGNEDSVKAFTSCVNKKIAALSLTDNALHFVMDDGTKMRLFDDGQSCCEHRYMNCDDRLSDFIGTTLLGAEVKPAAGGGCECGEHEIAFLEVKTDKGVFQCANHNEHNGYYGGFSIMAQLE